MYNSAESVKFDLYAHRSVLTYIYILDVFKKIEWETKTTEGKYQKPIDVFVSGFAGAHIETNTHTAYTYIGQTDK